jgi:SLOG cluster3 family
MSLRITSVSVPANTGRTLFLSASIPHPERWDGEFDALAITDAVVAISRTFLSAGWQLVTAAHPTIAPLLLYVAGELPVEGQRRITTYQSRLFADVLPTATKRFEANGIARFEWTQAAKGDRPEPGHWDESLAIMRRQMLAETVPDAAVFVGGMKGIHDEYELFGTVRPDLPRYALGAPGGAARLLVRPSSPLRELLSEGVVFPALARAILDDVT